MGWDKFCLWSREYFRATVRRSSQRRAGGD